MRAISVSIVGLVLIAAGSAANADIRVFDNFNAAPPNPVYIPSNAVTAGTGAPAAAGNRFMGQSVVLNGAGATGLLLTGLDLTVLNATGAALPAGTNVRINYWVYSGTTNDAFGPGPVFSSQLTAAASTFTLGAGGLPNNNFIPIASGNAFTPGLVFPVPLAITSFGALGFVFAIDIDTTGGTNFVFTNGVTTGITGGTAPNPVATAPIIGNYPAYNTNGTGGVTATSGYYRSPNGATDFGGNFAGTSWRNIGANSGLLGRVWAVPAPSAAALLGLGGLIATRRRRA